jgi:hypothetical protein
MKFKEENIRPEVLMKKAKVYFKKDYKYLLSKRKSFKHVNCPACNKAKKEYLFNKNGFKYYNCINCNTFYITPRPNDKLLSIFYKNSELYKFWNNFIFPDTERVRNKKIFLPRVKKIIQLCKKHKISRKKIIDVGAGYGTFCKIMKDKKFFKDVIAVEPNIDGSKKCIAKKIITLNLSIENLSKKHLRNVGVFTLFEVIEHLYNPYNFLKKINKMCSKNIFVICTCPNGMGFDISFLGKKSDAVDHEHLNYFNPHSIKILAKKTGFKVLDVITPGVLDVDILKNKFTSNLFKNKNNFLKQIFFDPIVADNLQDFLIKNKLSSNMWVVLKKVSN